jgi:hypothetical protein
MLSFKRTIGKEMLNPVIDSHKMTIKDFTGLSEIVINQKIKFFFLIINDLFKDHHHHICNGSSSSGNSNSNGSDYIFPQKKPRFTGAGHR